MSITRLQQARQMYAMGQRVAKTLDGSRPGYRGSDMATVAGENRAANTSAKNTSGADYAGGNQGGGGTGSDGQGNDYSSMTGKDIKDARRAYEVGVAGGYAKDQVVGPYGPYKPGYNYQPFLDYRPDFKPLPPLGPFGLLTNVLNKPFQKLSDFTTGKNRDFFMNEVVRAGKIPDLNFGTIAEMTPDELEAAYEGYLSDRSSGQIDAYGNPIGDNVGGNNDQGIATLYNYDMFDDSSVDENMEVANDPFVSRFLQNQPSDIRERIESKMQDYYTV